MAMGNGHGLMWAFGGGEGDTLGKNGSIRSDRKIDQKPSKMYSYFKIQSISLIATIIYIIKVVF